MNLIIYGIAPIIAQGILSMADKLNFINHKNVLFDETEISSDIKEEEPTIVIMPLERYLAHEKWRIFLKSSQFIKSILIADLYMLKSENTALDLGIADIIICKDCKEYELHHALWAAKESDKYFCSELIDFIFYNENCSGINEKVSDSLSEREIDVLKLIGKGLSSQQIAEQLFISKHTVNSHRKRIMQKLNLIKPTELVQLAATNFKP
jgi:DNA-binding NarL/FixJ family response regulator